MNCCHIRKGGLYWRGAKVCFGGSSKHKEGQAGIRSQVEATREEMERLMWLVKSKNGRMEVVALEEEWEVLDGRTVLFSCVSKEHNKAMDPPLEEIRPMFQKWMDEVEFYSRG